MVFVVTAVACLVLGSCQQCGTKGGGIVLNEICGKDSDGLEWIEIGNASNYSINLKGYKLWKLDGEGSVNMLEWNEHRPTAVVLGNEVKGVAQDVVDQSDYCLEIPQYGTKHSFNVSCTAAMVMWEFFRNRQEAK